MTSPLRLGFFMYDGAGHKTHYLNWRRTLESMPEAADPVWFPISLNVDEERFRQLRFLSNYRRWELRSWFKIRRELRANRFDAVLMNPAQMAVKHLSPLSKQPLFLFLDATRRQLESLAPWFPAGDTETGLLGGIRRQRQRKMVQAATGLFPASRWAANSLLEDYRADPARVHVFPFGIDPTVWCPAPSAEPRDGITRLLFVGGDFERKGGDLLLRWAKATSRKGWELHVVTPKSYEEIPGVYYHRASNNSDALISLVRRCHLLVLPTRADCNPFAVLESMSTGLAVLSTRVGAIPEMVIEGTTGALIEPDNYRALHDRLDALLEAPELLAPMGKAGREHVLANYDCRQIVRQTLEVILERA